MSSHQYEELYGVGLLDDLHNYFPAILYTPERFASVQSLLRYIQQQTRNRFDLFSLGEREYRGASAPSASPPPPPPPTTVPSVPVNVPLNDVSANRIPQNSNFPSLPRQSNRLSVSPFTSLQYVFNLPDLEEEENPLTGPLTTQLLASLLRLPTNPIVRGGAGLDSFLQPVPIRPTAEQIEANTTVGNLVSDEEHACAICQDNLLPEQEGRKLNTCGHWFHKHCIDTWLEGNVHCPVCRHDIRGSTSSNEETKQEDQ